VTGPRAGTADGGSPQGGDPRDRVDDLLAGLEARLRAGLRAGATGTTGRTDRRAPTATSASALVVIVEPD
jgi:hypothetical protein